MKLNYSLSLKITLIVISVSVALIFSLTFININWQAGFFEDDYRERSDALAKSLDVGIALNYELNDTQRLQTYIESVNDTNSELLEISINLVDGEEIIVAASTNPDYIGGLSNEINYRWLETTEAGDEKDITLLIIGNTGDSHTITVVRPVNLSGQIVGTYEMLFSMDKTYAILEEQVSYLVLLSVVSLFTIVFIFLYLLRKIIVKPIIAFRNTSNLIGEGNLDAEMEINSHDELGDLASAFNQMAKDLKKSRDKIEKYNKILENLLKQKDEFIGQLGHDLKNPLTPLVGLLPMIMEKEKDPKLKEHLRIMNRNVEYMQDLIFKTLQLAKLRSSNIKFDIEKLSLTEEVENVIESQKLFLKEKNIDVENKINKKIIVMGDKLRVAELFKNLIANAVKYTPEGGGKITIDAETNKGFVSISVKDTGIGMDKEQLSKVFDEFYKADKFSSEMHSSGLGLSICKRIVEKHGGKIWVESSGKGKGSIFCFTLKDGAKNN